jgi:hypothetical protein
MSSTSTAEAEIPVIAQTLKAQFISGLQQGHKITLEAAEALAKTTKSLPVPEMPSPPVIPGVPSVEAATKFVFDFATELLNSQRDFALEVSKLYTVKA